MMLTSGSGYIPSAWQVRVMWCALGFELDMLMDLTGAVDREQDPIILGRSSSDTIRFISIRYTTTLGKYIVAGTNYLADTFTNISVVCSQLRLISRFSEPRHEN